MKALDEGFTRKCKEVLKIMAEKPYSRCFYRGGKSAKGLFGQVECDLQNRRKIDLKLF